MVRNMSEWQVPALSGVSYFRYLDRCAAFFQEIVNVKSALAENRLAAYLLPDDVLRLVLPSDYAEHLSTRLLNILRQHDRDFQLQGAPAELRIHKTCLYLMAALADEIFLLELDWFGRDAWLDVLLEEKLFNSGNAGAHFFYLARQLLKLPRGNGFPLELAAVFLLVMQLGFKGCYRGHAGKTELLRLRRQLYQFIAGGAALGAPVNVDNPHGAWSLAKQAYQYNLSHGQDFRLAPVSPWKNLCLYALGSYLLLTIITWLLLLRPFTQYVGS